MRKLLLISLFFVLFLSSGCASKQMTYMEPPTGTISPVEGKSKVIFLRPSALGGAVQSVLFDATTKENVPIGILSYKSMVEYVTEPGEKQFMVVSEAADFMSANLLPDRIYFALVTPRMGFWRARFSLKPVPGTELGGRNSRDTGTNAAML